MNTKNASQCDATEIYDDKIFKKKRTVGNNTPKHNFQKNRQKISVNYRKISFDDFRLKIVDPPPEIPDEELKILSAYFCLSSENRSKKVISKMVIINHSKVWYKSNTQSHPGSTSMSPYEHISLKFCSIILKLC